MSYDNRFILMKFRKHFSKNLQKQKTDYKFKRINESDCILIFDGPLTLPHYLLKLFNVNLHKLPYDLPDRYYKPLSMELRKPVEEINKIAKKKLQIKIIDFQIEKIMIYSDDQNIKMNTKIKGVYTKC